MAKKKVKVTPPKSIVANKVSKEKKTNPPKAVIVEDPNKVFLFTKHNYIWMIVGLVLIFLGFGLMLGPDANTVDGKFDPNIWNPGIFSWRRIRLAPTLVVLGFVVEVYAIMSKPKPSPHV